MATKKQLQDTLKEQYGINKNISQEMSLQACEQLLGLMERESSISELVASFTDKNTELSNNNRRYGQLRKQAEQELSKTKSEYERLQELIGKPDPDDDPDEKQAALQKQIDDLTEVNQELKKDNKALKNSIDKIRLRLALNLRQVMQSQDSELRQAIARLFNWTQE